MYHFRPSNLDAGDGQGDFSRMHRMILHLGIGPRALKLKHPLLNLRKGMHLPSALLVTAVAFLVTSNAIASETGFHRTQELMTKHSGNKAKRFLLAPDKDDFEDRMFSVSTINGVLGKVGSVVETGGAKVVNEAPKLEKYQLWLKAGLTPSQVRVDVLGKAPWLTESFLLKHEDFYQYAKFMVEYKRQQPGSKIAKAASEMQKYELWLNLGLTPSQVRVDIMKKDPAMKAVYLARHKDFNQYAKFMGEYEKLHPGTTPFVKK
ncbi:unnamed protein product [Phytophthora fragariaefolia]|uniref:RxLR effector protein n=1 Tax=Phytophthora fragariaefolia TaxID=1490495 RepID=A0A9W6XF27_9STRA|nr:unnamed protein product [Phytophthora fragariaefolia]